jgi:hypothetical protein
MATATYQILADQLFSGTATPTTISFVIVQDNAHIPSVNCLYRARRVRWQSVPKMDSRMMVPKRTSTPPSGTLFPGSSTVTSPNSRNRSPQGTNNRRQQASLPRIPRRRNSKTNATLSQRIQAPATPTSPTRVSDGTSATLKKLYGEVSNLTAAAAAAGTSPPAEQQQQEVFLPRSEAKSQLASIHAAKSA